ncbi:MAG TPA: PKD domain-containing protein [Candidatus Dormibacteraeota bacterium]
MSLRTRLPDYSIGAAVLLVAIALPFFVFTHAQHAHRLQAQRLPLTAGGISALPATTPRPGGDGAGSPPSSTGGGPITPATDAAPVAALAVSPQAGASPLTVTADASGSTDTDQTPIAQVFIDFGDGTTLLANAQRRATHVYDTPGTYTVTATVIDSGQHTSKATATVSVG